MMEGKHICVPQFTAWLILLAGIYAYGQAPACGFDEMLARDILKDNTVYEKVAETARLLATDYLSTASGRGETVVPVVVHLLWQSAGDYISDAEVLEQMEILNTDFNGLNEDLLDVPEAFRSVVAHRGIRFCLATQTPDGFATTGIVRVRTNIPRIGIKEALYHTSSGGSDAWDTGRYLNIWVADTGEQLTGFGTFPNQTPPERQGVVVHPAYFGYNSSRRFNLGRVAVHEVGHYLGLGHIWGSCEEGDGVPDTPPQAYFYRGCPSHPQYSCGSNDMFMNYMDYVDDACMLMFTQGQMERMHRTLVLLRPNLASSPLPCSSEGGGELPSDFTIYPNPTSGSVTIDFHGSASGLVDVEVYSSLGQLVGREQKFIGSGQPLEIQVAPAGIYWLKIGRNVKKVIVL